MLRLALPSDVALSLETETVGSSSHMQNVNGSMLLDKGSVTPLNMTQNSNGSMVISPQGEEFTPGNMSRQFSLGAGITGGSAPGRRRSRRLLQYPEYATIATAGRIKASSKSDMSMATPGFATIATTGRRKAMEGSEIGVGRGMQGWRYAGSADCCVRMKGIVCGDVTSGSVQYVKPLAAAPSALTGNNSVTRVSGVASITAGNVMTVPFSHSAKANVDRTPRAKDQIQQCGGMQPGSSRASLLQRHGSQNRRSSRNSKRKKRKSRGLLCGIEMSSDSPIMSLQRRSPRIEQQSFRHNASLFSGNATCKSRIPDFSFHVPSLEKSTLSTSSMLEAVLSTMKRKSIFGQKEEGNNGSGTECHKEDKSRGNSELGCGIWEPNKESAFKMDVNKQTDTGTESDKSVTANTSLIMKIDTAEDDESDDEESKEDESDEDSSMNKTVIEQTIGAPKRKNSFRKAIESLPVFEDVIEPTKNTISFLDLADIPMIDDDYVEENLKVISRKASLRRSKSFAGIVSNRHARFTKFRDANASAVSDIDSPKQKPVRNRSFRSAVVLRTPPSDTISMDSGVQMDEVNEIRSNASHEDACSTNTHIPEITPIRSTRLNESGSKESRSPLVSVMNTIPRAVPLQTKSMGNLLIVKSTTPKTTACKSQSASMLEMKTTSKEEFQLNRRRRPRSVKFSEHPTEILPQTEKGTLKRKVSNAFSLRNKTLKRGKSFGRGSKEEGMVTVDAGRTPKPQRPPKSPYQERLIM